MRICPNCGRENGDDQDFCVCGEYLRWEPTQHIEALKPAGGEPAVGSPALPDAGPVPAPIDPNVTLPPATPAVAAAGRPAVAGVGAPGVASRATPGPGQPPSGAATLVLRLPDKEESATGPVSVPVTPGTRATIIALIRNESGIVDNYDVRVVGLPDGWWTTAPPTVYLVPYGTSGHYEQEVQVQVHPPRSPDAHAKPWPFEVVAYSRAYQIQVAGARAEAHIEPYQEVTSAVAPDRASGRLKARFKLTVRNRANAPTEVRLHAEDADGECQFRFAEPTVRIEPGLGVEAPVTVIPPKQIWIGRPKDRPVRISAIPVGQEQPPPARPVTYRQRPWLPWWLAVAVPIAALIAAAVILLLPKQTVVPNLNHAKSVFAAQKLVLAAGLKLSPQVGQMTAPGAPVGSVVAQIPAAGKKVKRGSQVSIQVAVGSGKVTVPSVTGVTPVTADTQLRAAGLVLGAVSPQPPDPNGQIASQIPAAKQQVAPGTPVAVFLQPAAAASATSQSGTTGGQAGKSGASAPKAVVLPIISGNPMAAAQHLSQLGFVPTSVPQFATAAPGALVSTDPPAGTSVPAGGKVKLIVSAGWPLLAYDNGSTIFLADRPGTKATALPAGGQHQDEASWSPDGTSLVYVQGPADAGQLMAVAAGKQGARATALTAATSNDHHPVFAPIASPKLLTYIDDSGGGSKLCFGIVGPNPLAPACTSHPGWSLGRQISWSKDGTKILVLGIKNGTHGSVFGLIQFTTNLPFSPQASLWGQGRVVTDISHPGQGVAAAAFSPDGTQVALVSNIGTAGFYAFVAPATDFKLAPPAKALGVRACQVAWRPDGKALALVQADSACSATLGNIVEVNPSSPTTFSSIATQAENPSWQPRSLGG
jgi:beta-lactam-binding protein with PASTA domain